MPPGWYSTIACAPDRHERGTRSASSRRRDIHKRCSRGPGNALKRARNRIRQTMTQANEVMAWLDAKRAAMPIAAICSHLLDARLDATRFLRFLHACLRGGNTIPMLCPAVTSVALLRVPLLFQPCSCDCRKPRVSRGHELHESSCARTIHIPVIECIIHDAQPPDTLLQMVICIQTQVGYHLLRLATPCRAQVCRWKNLTSRRVEVKVCLRPSVSRFGAGINVSMRRPFSALHVVADMASEYPVRPLVYVLGKSTLGTKVIHFALAFLFAISANAEEHVPHIAVKPAPF